MKKMKLERLKRGWSQTRLGELAGGLHVSDISKIEKGLFVPYDSYLQRISLALGIPADELLEEVDADDC